MGSLWPRCAEIVADECACGCGLLGRSPSRAFQNGTIRILDAVTSRSRKHPDVTRKRENVKRRDPIESSRKILLSGMKHFARYGLGGARVVDIIKDAGLSHRMLYHYYENKEALYLATLEFAYKQIRDAELSLHISSLEPVEGMRRIVEFTFDYFIDHPEFMALLSQENLNGGKFISQLQHFKDVQRPLVDGLRDLFERGKSTGRFRKVYDPVHFYISLSGLCYFAISNRFTLAAAFDESIMSESFIEERRAHITAFVMQAVLETTGE
jgi:AcrR family transcriptional regulator